MTQTDLLGYYTHPKPYPHAPGGTRLDIILRAEPTELHFDPEKVHLTVATPAGDVRRTLITHASAIGPEPLHVCAGRVVLADRVEKRVQFLTLGGSMTLTREEDLTRCLLSSPAPIIELSLMRDKSEILAAEIENMLAQRRAHWEAHSREFERRLAAADPAALYMASLVALRDRMQTMRSASLDGDEDRLSHFLNEEIAFLCGDGAPGGPALDSIL